MIVQNVKKASVLLIVFVLFFSSFSSTILAEGLVTTNDSAIMENDSHSDNDSMAENEPAENIDIPEGSSSESQEGTENDEEAENNEDSITGTDDTTIVSPGNSNGESGSGEDNVNTETQTEKDHSGSVDQEVIEQGGNTEKNDSAPDKPADNDQSFSEAPDAEVQSNPQFNQEDRYFKVIVDDAPILVKRDGKLEQAGTLQGGQIYPRERDFTTWHQIQFGNSVAYISKEYTEPISKPSINNEAGRTNYQGSLVTLEDSVVYDNSSGKLVPFASIKKGEEYPVVNEYTSWFQIVVSDRIGYISKDNVKPNFSSGTKYFAVNEDNLPIYIKKDGRLVEVGSLKAGQIYPREHDFTSWHGIQFGDIEAYVPKDGTSPSGGSSLKNESSYSAAGTFTVNEDSVIYDNTSGDLVPFAVMRKDTEYHFIKEYTSWLEVVIAGRSGFINKDNISREFTERTKYFETVQSGLPVYVKKNGKLIEVAALNDRQVYPRVNDFTSWHEIQYGKSVAYVKKTDTRPSSGNSLKNESNNPSSYTGSIEILARSEVYDNTSGSLVPYLAINQGEKYPIVREYGSWYEIVISNRRGFVHKENARKLFTSDTKYFEVQENNTPVYKKENGNLTQIGSLKSGQTFPRNRDYTSWHEISFGKNTAFVPKDKTVPSSKDRIRNLELSPKSIGYLTTKVNTVVYDNTSGKLIPYANLNRGTSYVVTKVYSSWYQINVAGRFGFVSKNDVTAYVARNLVNPNTKYSYTQMVKDINELKATYPDLISTKIIGKSVDGRNIHAVKLGKGKTEIFLNGAHHAREWLTTNLLMEMIDEYARGYTLSKVIDGYNVKNVLNSTSIWFVPMVNPDGVTLNQFGHTTAKRPAEVLKINGYSKDFTAWKANIRGVDLNRQYPAGWDAIRNNPGKPSPQNYKGPRPLSEPEAKAIFDFTLDRNFKIALAYHSSGEILYWSYKTKGDLRDKTRKLALMISAKTGYSLVKETPNPSGGGYTDWFLESMKRPGFTPEISPYVGQRPVPVSSFPSIWRKNHSIGLMMASEALKL
ncbi:hypothetical protein LG298_23760 [Cytobacillus firmus]|uniref:M14 family metallopeptidase n=1 Tax=Cytobacillus firmus TaxID=1399 RepID=UPI00384CED6D